MSEYHANTPIIYLKIIVYFNTNKQIKHKTKYKTSPRQKTHESHRSRTNKLKKKTKKTPPKWFILTRDLCIGNPAYFSYLAPICGYHIMLPQTFKRSFNMLLIVYYHTEEKKLSDNVITRYNVDMDFMEW